jgi:hypothetical protein
MDVHALTIEAVRDGPVCTLVLRGDPDLSEASELSRWRPVALDSDFPVEVPGRPGPEAVTVRLRPGSAR